MNRELLDFKWMENDKPFFAFIHEFYFSIQQRKFSRLANSHTFKYQTIFHYLEPGATVMDPCSGSGMGAWYLKECGYEVQSLERNPFLCWVQERRGLSPVNVDILEFLPTVLENSYDGIVFIDAIEHFEEEDQNFITSQFHRILKPGGVLVMDTPKAKKTRRVSDEHLRELSWFDFGQLIASHGFRNIKRFIHVWDQYCTVFRIDGKERKDLAKGACDQVIVAEK